MIGKIKVKTAAVSGAGGFIGSHLVETLLDQGFHVKCLTHYNSRNDWGWLEDLHYRENIEVIVGDILDKQICDSLCKDADYVFHLAALIGIPYSYDAPNSYVLNNIEGTMNMCQSALENNVKRFIQTSTSEVYGTAQYIPIDESHPLQPQSPYSASKIGADSMAMSFYNAFNLPVTIARPFNTYGPRQSARAVIPTIITQLLSGKQSINLGSLDTTRDFNYVSDTCSGFLAIAEADKTIGEVINIGSNSEISIEELFNLICKLTSKSNIGLITDNQRIRPKNSEVYRLVCDNSKIKELTKYSPAIGLQAGLENSIDWYKDEKNLVKFKTNIYNV